MPVKETLKNVATAAYDMNARTVCNGIVKRKDVVLDGIITVCGKLKSNQGPAAPKVSFRERLIQMLEPKKGEPV